MSPDQLLADAELVNEARPEDELTGPERAFAPFVELNSLREPGSKEAVVPPLGKFPVAPADPCLGSVRKLVMERSTAVTGALGEEIIPVSAHEAGGSSGWHTIMMPATEVPCWELSDDLLQAERVTRVTDTR